MDQRNIQQPQKVLQQQFFELSIPNKSNPYSQQTKLSPTNAECLKNYQHFFKDVEVDYKQIVKNLKGNDLNELIYDKSIRNSDLQIKLRSRTTNYEILRYQLCWLGFKGIITVLNVQKISLSHKLKDLSNGKISIYQIPDKNKNYVIKCYLFENVVTPLVLVRVLQQYFLMIVAAAIGVGPFVSPSVAGFDIVMYQSCIQFSMERCQPFKKWNKQYQLSLKKQLKLMHELKIMHLDIKPQNVLFSPSRNSPVFIDYGYSSIIKEQVGFSTFTLFKGSPNFCSKQMLALFDRPANNVDLYYNDVYCLEETFSSFRNYIQYSVSIVHQLQNQIYDISSDIQMQKKAIQVNRNQINLLNLFKTKYYLYLGVFIGKNQPQFTFLKQNARQIIDFLMILPYHVNRQKIFNTLIKAQYMWQSASLSNIFQLKKINIFKQQNQERIISFKNKMVSIPEQMHKIFQMINQKELIKEFILSQNVLVAKIIKNNGKKLYLQHLTTFLNLTQLNSTWQQKIQAIKVWKQYQQFSCKLGMTELEQYGFCIYKILRDYLQNHQLCDIKNIQILMFNLIILEPCPMQQIIILLNKIKKLPIDYLSLARLYFNMYHARYWYHQKINSRYDIADFKAFLSAILIPFPNQSFSPEQSFSDSEKNQIMNLLGNYIIHHIHCQTHLDLNIQLQQYQKFLIQSHFFDIDFKRQIYKSFLMIKMQYSKQNFKNNWNLIDYINQNLNLSLNSLVQKPSLSYYYPNFFHLLKKSKDYKHAIDIYKIFQQCLQNAKLFFNTRIQHDYRQLLFYKGQKNIDQYLNYLISYMDSKTLFQACFWTTKVFNFFVFWQCNKFRQQFFSIQKLQNMKKAIQLIKNKNIHLSKIISQQLVGQQTYKNQYQHIRSLVKKPFKNQQALINQIHKQELFVCLRECQANIRLYQQIYTDEKSQKIIVLVAKQLCQEFQQFINPISILQDIQHPLTPSLIFLKITIYRLQKNWNKLANYIISLLAAQNCQQKYFLPIDYILIQFSRMIFLVPTLSMQDKQIYLHQLYKFLFRFQKINLLVQNKAFRLDAFFQTYLVTSRDYQLFQLFNNQILIYLSRSAMINAVLYYYYTFSQFLQRYKRQVNLLYQFIISNDFISIPEQLEYKVIFYSQLLFSHDIFNSQKKCLILTILNYVQLLAVVPRNLCLEIIYSLLLKLYFDQGKTQQHNKSTDNKSMRIILQFQSIKNLKRYCIFLFKKLIKIQKQIAFSKKSIQKQLIFKENIFFKEKANHRLIFQKKLTKFYKNICQIKNQKQIVFKSH